MVGLLRWIQRDWQKFRQRDQATEPKSGMHTYRFELPGGQRRVHLRVDRSGDGTLFVDVTDVIHLNRTATVIAWMALEKTPRELARKILIRNASHRDRSMILNDLQAIYSMVDRFADPRLGCPTCSLGSVDRQPLFSTAVTAPYKVDLAITYKCNNDCPHCYNEADRLTLEAMPASDWKRVIDKLHQVGVPHLIFTGGEATLYQDLPELIAHANALGPICGLNTNGRRLGQRGYAKTLAEAGLNHIQVTLGSHRAAVHDRMMNAKSFQQTIDGIQAAQEAGLHTITNTTLMKMNAGEIVQTIDFLYSLGIRTFAVNGMIYSGGGFDTGQALREEQMPALLIRIRDRAAELGMRFLWYTPTMYCRLSPVELEIGAKRCNAAEYSICVEPNADVLPCQSFYVSAGNLLRDPWEKIWESSLFHSFRDRELDPKAAGLPEMCWECPDLPLCGGGCRIEREAAAGQRSSASGCSSGGCGSKGGSGGCSSGGCSSGGCKTIQISSISFEPDSDFESDDSLVDAPGSAQVLPLGKPESGFVAFGNIGIAKSKRRGSGNFAEPTE